MNTTPTPDQTPEEPKTAADYARGLDALRKRAAQDMADMNSGRPVNAVSKALADKDALIAALRARLEEAEKVRDAAYREAEILRTNATYVKKVLDCANRYMPDLVKGAITVEGAIQERDALRATNATMAERVRRLEEALNAADSVMWMAERYAEGGGANGPEMRDYLSATRIVLKVRGSYHNPSPTPGAAVGKEGE